MAVVLVRWFISFVYAKHINSVDSTFHKQQYFFYFTKCHATNLYDRVVERSNKGICLCEAHKLLDVCEESCSGEAVPFE